MVESARRWLITEEQYDQLLEEQDDGCAICHEPEIMRRRGKLVPLAVDHDHANGIVRGLLCHRCNMGLGYFKDDAQRLLSAVEYLRDYHAALSAFIEVYGREQTEAETAKPELHPANFAA